MVEVVCRRPTPEEAGAVCALIRRILMTDFPAFPPEAIDDYLAPWTPGAVTARLESGLDVIITALTGDELIGLVSGAAPEGGVGTVMWLLVDARWRGRRAGRALYDASCRAYRDLGAHKMKLTAPSERAKGFYEICGMRLEGVHPNHWYHATFFSLGVVL